MSPSFASHTLLGTRYKYNATYYPSSKYYSKNHISDYIQVPTIISYVVWTLIAKALQGLKSTLRQS